MRNFGRSALRGGNGLSPRYNPNRHSTSALLNGSLTAAARHCSFPINENDSLLNNCQSVNQIYPNLPPNPYAGNLKNRLKSISITKMIK